ncbi:Ecdysone-inducible protein E75 [Eumeta japonica]|uniref:Ecdysone-inducible protein E75 n=1 Tax=Eumeta variegata TaxID=151549 RepID=A0A4C1Y3H1_EUMVA|nr:Ecdysone-inducible protein E75 [Eumeta japonica]
MGLDMGEDLPILKGILNGVVKYHNARTGGTRSQTLSPRPRARKSQALHDIAPLTSFSSRGAGLARESRNTFCRDLAIRSLSLGPELVHRSRSHPGARPQPSRGSPAGPSNSTPPSAARACAGGARPSRQLHPPLFSPDLAQFEFAVRFGRVPKREKARILAAMQQSSVSRAHEQQAAAELEDAPRLLARVVRAHLDTCEFTRDRVAAMRARARDSPTYSQPTLACPLNPAPELQSEKEFSQRFAHVIRGVIDFAGLIPGFQLLTQDDKFTLLKSGLFDALFVRLICMFDAPLNSIICLNGQLMKRDSIQSGANARFLVDSTFKFAERINSMNLSDAEIGLFCAIVLITPDRPGLRNIELVERMHARLKACLQTVVAQNRPDRPGFLHELMDTLPDLRTLSTLHTEKLVVFRTEHKELLRQQMWAEEESGGWADSGVDDAARSPLGSVSSSESGETAAECGAPLLAATLAGRRRLDSRGSVDEEALGVAHLAHNGLTVTAVRPPPPRYRKLDSPTDSGIESGNEKHERLTGPGSGCSSPRSSLEEHPEERRGAMPADDMPVLKRVLQAPPLYDASSLMDEAYKPHKKFRAMRRDTGEAEARAVRPAPSPQPPAHPHPASPAHPAHLRLSTESPRPGRVSLSSTHSVLAKSLMEGPRMTPEQLKRTDIIQQYMRRSEAGVAETCPLRAGGLATCPYRSGGASPASVVALQVDVASAEAEAPQPLNLSKKSPSPARVGPASPPAPARAYMPPMLEASSRACAAGAGEESAID